MEATAPPLSRGEHVCVPWRAVGTHRGDIGSVLPASDRFVSLHGLHYLELSDGLVRRARGFFDLYDAATQLGLLPARGGMGETVLLMLRGFGLRRRAYLTTTLRRHPRVHAALVLERALLRELVLEGLAVLDAARAARLEGRRS